MAYNSAYTGSQVDAAVGAVREKESIWDGKQDKLSGTEDQLVGFNSAGKAVAVPMPDADDVGAIQAPDGGTDGQILTKTADGVAWEDAPDTGVTSFNDRAGAVIPQDGDYTAEMVGARPNTWTPSAADVGAVPITRTINDKPLNDDVTLNASDIGARPSTWTPSAADVGAVPTSRTVNGKSLSSNITLTHDDVGAAAPISRETITLSASGWSSKKQTKTVTGVSADETAQMIWPTPKLSSQEAYYEAGIRVTAQAANSLTFTCSTVPTSNLTVYVVIQEVQ